MRRIILVNQKGGCGKTTTAINVACCLALKGKKVLLIDLDPQGHSGKGLGVQPDLIENSIYEVLAGKIAMEEAIMPVRENLDAVFSNIVLSAFEQLMAGQPEREYTLSRSLSAIEDKYDYLIMDSPPGVGLLSFNGLMAADEAIIPVEPSSFSLDGVDKLLETIQLVKDKAGHDLAFSVLATHVDQRTNFSKKVLFALREQFPQNCFTTYINTSTRLKEATYYGKPACEYDRRCSAFFDYSNLTEEIQEKAAVKRKKGNGKIKILFSLQAPADSQVQIAGDFNGWTPENLHFVTGEGGAFWQKSLTLAAGEYQYKYLVNGNWTQDPENLGMVDDPFGDKNSVISV
ncbi:MAG: AAA family ATPase [Desulfobulbaceae bacterium]|uniref:AAA family ATPase n=1 Tax=Candidatus Desulfobia pelagia TaxID=2841692 RepID=A0A8J6TF22_9BACT|nr:AAA family ATPase [Candidatus Desulfobia pelagia]